MPSLKLFHPSYEAQTSAMAHIKALHSLHRSCLPVTLVFLRHVQLFSTVLPLELLLLSHWSHGALPLSLQAQDKATFTEDSL